MSDKTQFKELRERSGMSIAAFARYFGLAYRTAISWEVGERKCQVYLLDLMEYKLKNEGLLE